MKSLPIGCENFINTVTSSYYIDKTLIIKDLVELPKNSVILFTRPRRFGKSLMLSMFKSFFETEQVNNRDCFSNLKIAKHPDIINSYMNKYEVIEINMKDCFGDNENELILKIKQVIINEFQRHKSILSSLDEDDKTLFNSFLDYNLDTVLFRSSLKTLSCLIKKATSQPPILLMDEYDSPILSAYEKKYYDKVYTFIKGLYSETFKGNDNLRLSILSGVTRAGKMSLFSGLNNLIVDTVLDTKFDSMFGFTIEETKQLLDYYGHGNEFDNVRQWYGGYRFGNTEIFNPWSVLYCIFNDFNYMEYWASTTTSSLLKALIQNNYLTLNERIYNLINNKQVGEFIDITINYDDINTTEQSILSFLLFMGYLTYEDKFEGVYYLKLVNKEIRSVFSKELINVLIGNQNLLLCKNLKYSFINENIEDFSSMLEQYLLNSLSYFDFKNEKNYQIMLLTMFSITFDDCLVKSEANFSEGRCDIVIIPKKQNGTGYIIEVKHIAYKTSKERLNERANSALNQIITNKYYADLEKLDLDHIIAFGLAFSKQTVSSISKKIK